MKKKKLMSFHVKTYKHLEIEMPPKITSILIKTNSHTYEQIDIHFEEHQFRNDEKSLKNLIGGRSKH